MSRILLYLLDESFAVIVSTFQSFNYSHYLVPVCDDGDDNYNADVEDNGYRRYYHRRYRRRARRSVPSTKNCPQHSASLSSADCSTACEPSSITRVSYESFASSYARAGSSAVEVIAGSVAAA
ncbi:hypothetical protein DFQ27_009464 [Actinomortierella ambigua]|uniref:Uncharacterized protein n=1 Tax=Actinomortierella ambigua TaxID=1343610 RepID=A0A9P6TX56_9FUNG|nr:hypothetical protein DFQ27_009464 [Actinomortierella ambigua]